MSRVVYRDMQERLLVNSLEMENGCWQWLGRATKDGYGLINVRQGSKHVARRAHHVAYEFFIGPVPAGLELDHKCYNRRCIHPNHVIPATRQQNNANRRGYRSNHANP